MTIIYSIIISNELYDQRNLSIYPKKLNRISFESFFFSFFFLKKINSNTFQSIN